MNWRPRFSDLTSPALAKAARWVENVLCVRPEASTSPPVESPSGSCWTSSRNALRRVGCASAAKADRAESRSEEHTSELQSLMRISYAVFCLKKKKHNPATHTHNTRRYKSVLSNNIHTNNETSENEK